MSIFVSVNIQTSFSSLCISPFVFPPTLTHSLRLQRPGSSSGCLRGVALMFADWSQGQFDVFHLSEALHWPLTFVETWSCLSSDRERQRRENELAKEGGNLRAALSRIHLDACFWLVNAGQHIQHLKLKEDLKLYSGRNTVDWKDYLFCIYLPCFCFFLNLFHKKHKCVEQITWQNRANKGEQCIGTGVKKIKDHLWD